MADPTHDPLAEHPLGNSSRDKTPAEAESLPMFNLPEEGTPERKKRSGRLSKKPEVLREDAGWAQEERAASLDEEVEEAGIPLSVEESDSHVAFTRRIVSGLADLLILALVGTVQLAAGAVVLELRFPLSAFWGISGFLVIVALVLLVLVPFVWGTTPGMALVDIKIRAEDGGPPTLGAAFLRFLGFVVTVITAGIPLLLAAFDRRGRTLADFFSRTTVVPLHEEQGPLTEPDAA